MNDWDDYVFPILMSLVIVIVLSLLGWSIYYEVNYPTLYTVRHGENVHHGASIRVGVDNGIIRGTDSDGRSFIYRDGWEAIQEEK